MHIPNKLEDCDVYATRYEQRSLEEASDRQHPNHNKDEWVLL